MATLNIGGKKIKVGADYDQLSEAEKKRFVRRVERELGVSTSLPAKTKSETTLKDVARFSLGQGLALGFGDEIEAGFKALTTDETYGDAVGRIRGEMDEYRADNAGKALAMELGGGLLTGGVGAGRAAAMAGGRAAIKAAAKAGAGTGAIAGFGSGEGVEGRLTGAAIGGAAGGVLGAALPAAGQLVKGTAKRVGAATDLISEKGAQKASDLKILQSMDREGLDPTQVYKRLAQANRQGVDDTMLVDVMEESGRGLASGATNVSGKARTIAEKALDDRQLKSGFGIADDVSDVIGQGKSADDALAEITLRQKANAGKDYDAAFMQNGEPTGLTVGDDLADLFDIPAFQKAAGQARRVAQLEGVAIPDIKDIQKGAQISLQHMHYMKMGLDDVLGMAKRDPAATGIGRTELGLLKGKRADLIKMIDDAAPEVDGQSAYKIARNKFAGDARMRDAVEDGQKFFKMKPAELKRSIDDMSDSERESFRIGVADAISSRIESRRDLANTAQDLFGNERYRKLLRSTFPDEKSFGAFEKRMRARINQEVTRSRTKPTAGSRTANLAEDGRDINRDAELGMNLLTLNLPAVGRDVVTRGGGLGKRIGTNVAGDLFDTNLASQKETLRRLNALRASEAARLSRSNISGARIGGGVGATTGLLTN